VRNVPRCLVFGEKLENANLIHFEQNSPRNTIKDTTSPNILYFVLTIHEVNGEPLKCQEMESWMKR
jgi:hypothetical protein